MDCKWNRRILAALFIGGASMTFMLWVFDPATSGAFPPCPIHYLTGWYCPGCGSLRAIHQLLHGNLYAAWAFNPLAVLFLPFVVYGLAAEALKATNGRGLPQPFIPGGWIRALCVVIVCYGVVRNLPVHPFDLLAPGAMLRF
jgi:hypothetical protein